MTPVPASQISQALCSHMYLPLLSASPKAVPSQPEQQPSQESGSEIHMLHTPRQPWCQAAPSPFFPAPGQLMPAPRQADQLLHGMELGQGKRSDRSWDEFNSPKTGWPPIQARRVPLHPFPNLKTPHGRFSSLLQIQEQVGRLLRACSLLAPRPLPGGSPQPVGRR